MTIIPWSQPPPIDVTLWSRPCGKCGHRIDKCVCKGGPTEYGKAVNDGGGYDHAAIQQMMKRLKMR